MMSGCDQSAFPGNTGAPVQQQLHQTAQESHS